MNLGEDGRAHTQSRRKEKISIEIKVQECFLLEHLKWALFWRSTRRISSMIMAIGSKQGRIKPTAHKYCNFHVVRTTISMNTFILSTNSWAQTIWISIRIKIMVLWILFGQERSTSVPNDRAFYQSNFLNIITSFIYHLIFFPSIIISFYVLPSKIIFII